MILALIQARMGSSRFPGKVLEDLAGHPLLWHVVKRVRRSGRVDKVVVATTDRSTDEPIARFCEEQGIGCFRGSEQDVLDRFYQAAKASPADALVRITADCPLIDPDVIDAVASHFAQGSFDWLDVLGATPVLIAKLAVGGFALALIETLSAKMRIFRAPEFLGTAFLLAVLAMLVNLLLGS